MKKTIKIVKKRLKEEKKYSKLAKKPEKVGVTQPMRPAANPNAQRKHARMLQTQQRSQITKKKNIENKKKMATKATEYALLAVKKLALNSTENKNIRKIIQIIDSKKLTLSGFKGIVNKISPQLAKTIPTNSLIDGLMLDFGIKFDDPGGMGVAKPRIVGNFALNLGAGLELEGEYDRASGLDLRISKGAGSVGLNPMTQAAQADLELPVGKNTNVQLGASYNLKGGRPSYSAGIGGKFEEQNQEKSNNMKLIMENWRTFGKNVLSEEDKDSDPFLKGAIKLKSDEDVKRVRGRISIASFLRSIVYHPDLEDELDEHKEDIMSGKPLKVVRFLQDKAVWYAKEEKRDLNLAKMSAYIVYDEIEKSIPWADWKKHARKLQYKRAFKMLKKIAPIDQQKEVDISWDIKERNKLHFTTIKQKQKGFWRLSPEAAEWIKSGRDLESQRIIPISSLEEVSPDAGKKIKDLIKGSGVEEKKPESEQKDGKALNMQEITKYLLQSGVATRKDPALLGHFITDGERVAVKHNYMNPAPVWTVDGKPIGWFKDGKLHMGQWPASKDLGASGRSKWVKDRMPIALSRPFANRAIESNHRAEGMKVYAKYYQLKKLPAAGGVVRPRRKRTKKR